ncbi:MAG: DUF4296 domain-containing protein [Bacteroidota bacterium]
MRLQLLVGMIMGLLLGSACEEEIKTTLPEEKLVEVLVDVHMAQSALQSIDRERSDSLGRVYYDQIFQIHEVEEATFRKDVVLIRSNPELSKSVYEKVMEALSTHEARQKENKDKDRKEEKKEETIQRDSSEKMK